jgi:hypothetical protein
MQASLWIVPLGGVLVLSTYVWGLRQKDIAPLLWGEALSRPKVKVYWSAFAVLTAVSFLYLFTLWSILADEEVAPWWLWLGFLVSAICWMPLSIAALRQHPVRLWVSVNLWCTALFSIGFLWYALADYEKEHHGSQRLAVVASLFMVIQHLVWDAMVWDATWDPSLTRKKMRK